MMLPTTKFTIILAVILAMVSSAAAAAFDDLCVVSSTSSYSGDYVYAGMYGGYPFWEKSSNGMAIYMDVFTTRKWILDDGIDPTVKSVNGATNDSKLASPWDGTWTVADMAVLQGSCSSVTDVCVLNLSHGLGGDYTLVTNDVHEGYPYWKHTSSGYYLYKNEDGGAWRIYKSLNTNVGCYTYADNSSVQFPWESAWFDYQTAMVAGTCTDAS